MQTWVGGKEAGSRNHLSLRLTEQEEGWEGVRISNEWQQLIFNSHTAL